MGECRTPGRATLLACLSGRATHAVCGQKVRASSPDFERSALIIGMALAEYAALHLHMGAGVRSNCAAPPCIAALDPIAALERDIGVGGGSNTTTA